MELKNKLDVLEHDEGEKIPCSEGGCSKEESSS